MATKFGPQTRLAFGPFELNASTGELRKRGIRVRLSGQPSQILLLLLTHPGEVVTREQLRERIWSDGTFVDFEAGLNAAMAKLRRSLGDSAETPRYIETVPGRGYRFLAKLDFLNPASEDPVADTVRDASIQFGNTAEATKPVELPKEKRLRSWGWFAVTFCCAALSAALAWWIRGPKAPSLPLWKLAPLTTSAALEDWPSISPDGKLVVYSADPDFNGKLDLYLKHIGGGVPVRLTSDGEGNRMPDFSPDGSRIAFRSNRDGGGIYQMPVFGGEVQLVTRGGLNPKFSPDGQQIAYWTGSETVGAAVPGSGSVWIVPARGGKPVRITGHFTSARQPIWLPDGNSVLFVGYSSTRAFDRSSIDWWVSSLDGERLTRTGLYEEIARQGIQPINTSVNSRIRTPVPGIYPPGCWSQQQDAVITSIESGDNTNIWAIGFSLKTRRISGELTRLTTGTANEVHASCSSAGNVAFTNMRIKRELWMLQLDPDQAKPKDAPRQIMVNAADRENPTFSADGRYMAFVSNESGRPNIWERDLKTGNETQVEASAFVQRYPLMSPSGRKIAYSVYEPENRALYLASTGHPPVKLCEGCTRATDWSHDENELLIFSDSPYKIASLDLSSHQQKLLLTHSQYSLLYGRFSPDHRWISFTARIGPDLAKIAIAPLNGGTPVPEDKWIVIANVGLDDYANWSANGKILYFSSQKDGNSCLYAQHIDPATGAPRGKEFAVQHFHGRVSFGYGGWMAVASRVGISLIETTSNVWMMWRQPGARTHTWF